MTGKEIPRIRGVIQGKRRGYQKNPKKMQGHFLEQPEGEKNPHKPLGELDCDSRQRNNRYFLQLSGKRAESPSFLP